MACLWRSPELPHPPPRLHACACVAAVLRCPLLRIPVARILHHDALASDHIRSSIKPLSKCFFAEETSKTTIQIAALPSHHTRSPQKKKKKNTHRISTHHVTSHQPMAPHHAAAMVPPWPSPPCPRRSAPSSCIPYAELLGSYSWPQCSPRRRPKDISIAFPSLPLLTASPPLSS